jgi:hypothetical protein
MWKLLISLVGALGAGLFLAINVSALATPSGAGSATRAGIDIAKGTSVLHEFRVLRRVPPKATAATLAAAHRFADDPGVRGLDIDWARMARATTQHGFTVFAVPARHHLCLMSRSGIGTGLICRPSAEAVKTGLAVRVLVDETGDTMILGLVPDDVSVVEVESDSANQVGVQNNAFVTPGGRAAAGGLRWSDGTRDHVEPLAPSPIGR